jgi:hypothetical protein
MITYEIDSYPEGYDSFQEIHCFFCGKIIIPNLDESEAEIGNCKHLVYCCTSDTWDSPESSNEEIFKNYDLDDTDDGEYEFLDKNLSDKYLMIVSSGPPSGPLDGIVIFKQ